MSNINIPAIYDKYTKAPDVMVNYEEIKSVIDPNEKPYFQVYVDLYINFQRKPTLVEFTDKINELNLSNSFGSMAIKGGKRRRLRKSSTRRKSKRRRGTKRRR